MIVYVTGQLMFFDYDRQYARPKRFTSATASAQSQWAARGKRLDRSLSNSGLLPFFTRLLNQRKVELHGTGRRSG